VSETLSMSTPPVASARAIQLIGIDVDGTLVGSSGVVPQSVWEAASHATSRGIRLMLCSGRPAFGTAMDYARRLDPDGWHAFQNGASIVHLPGGQSRSVPLPHEVVKNLIAAARSSGEVLELYGDTDYVAESELPWAHEHAALLGIPFERRPFEALGMPVVRAQWLMSPERASEIMASPHPALEMARSSSPLMPGVQFVGITRAGVSKAYALQTVAAEYGVSLSNAMYVGDSGNDLPALAAVGHPVAMGNAEPAVIRAARHIVGDVESAGLVQALEWAIASVGQSPRLSPL
jgi:Cof subfamily protein (haloacid dehalogenase superfamily)